MSELSHLDQLEADVNDGETDVLSGAHEDYLDRIIAWRRELLRLIRKVETNVDAASQGKPSPKGERLC